MRVAVAVLIVALSACGTDSDAPAIDAGSLGPVVQTSLGTLEGSHVDEAEEVLVFRSVPFSKPPVGELRWRPPEPAEPWQGTRSAATFSKPCWQPITPPTSIYSRGEFERSEDCLYLNLWTPAETTNDGLPVMVWFHGGGHRTGHANSPTFDGTALASKGVVLVSVNYRLGHLGFFAHPALTAESPHASSGNYGILDKVASLEWVRDNVGAFGGDPGNVTIFGQSAGGASVCTLMASPLAKGLLHKVIGHSGTCMDRRMELSSGSAPDGSGASAHDLGVAAADELGVEVDGKEAAAALRAVDPKEFLALAGPARSPGIQVDGWVVPRQMHGIFADREHNDVPLIAGWLADEGKGLFAGLPESSEGELETLMKSRFGDRASTILATYSEEIAESPKTAQQAIQADAAFGLGTRTWVREVSAAGSPAYLYFFTHPPPVFLLYRPDLPAMVVPGGPRSYGAYHSGDLPYAFGNLHLVGHGWTDEDRRISSVMSQYWVNFARTGDPNGPGLPAWPRYETDSGLAIELAAEIGVTERVRHAKLDLFEQR